MTRNDVHLLTPRQLRELANPLREEILGLLCREALSARRLRERLSDAPANLHYHLGRLESAGLVELIEERPVRGVTEKFFRAVAANFSVAPDALSGLHGSGAEHRLVQVLRRHANSVVDELGPALSRADHPPPLTSYQRLRLSPKAAERLRQRLLEWLEECRAADGKETGEGELEDWLLLTAFFARAAP